jgi:hypothetical protein
MKKIQSYDFDNEWLGLNRPDEYIYNPLDYVFQSQDTDVVMKRLLCVMSNPDYFRFATRFILNIDILPFQMVILKELWNKKYPMIIASRGASKSWTMSVYALLRALFLPKRKIIIVGSAFRQSKVLFSYMEEIWNNAPILRSLCTKESGPYKDPDRLIFKINNSVITCLPLGTGDKIRGARAHDIITDEFASIPIEIFETVVAGFANVSSSPNEKVKHKRRQKLGITPPEEEFDSTNIGNQIVLAGTAYYEFNHFAKYWKDYHARLSTKGDPAKISELLGDKNHSALKWDSYSIIRIPVSSLPEGLMDEGMIARAKATVHAGIFDMEYGAIFSSDSQGFFKRTLIESCVVSHSNEINLPSGPVIFEPKLYGSKDCKYIYGIDPASEVDNFSIVALEVHPDHRRIVYSWTTNRQQHKEKLNSKLTTETDFYSYCARKIRDLLKIFPCQEIAMDSQGGGRTISEALHDKSRLSEGEIPIWPVIDPEKPEDTDDYAGLHILKLCNFAKADWTAEANHGLRKDFEDKVLLFPYYDPVSIELAIESDNINGTIYDTLEDCIYNIENLKNELSMINIVQTPAGRERWDTPEYIIGTGKKGRLRKDRYSALVMANMSARTKPKENFLDAYKQYGGFAQMIEREKLGEGDDYDGPEWFKDSVNNNSGYYM